MVRGLEEPGRRLEVIIRRRSGLEFGKVLPTSRCRGLLGRQSAFPWKVSALQIFFPVVPLPAL